eukprot:GGOE01020062.1.p1 GENE.GGOE01020062.1~~GGOE01020062.1.p1  ORF type:complete len:383 (-),score=68.42 GGOE01020062.1:48-1196(-)
MPRPAGSIPAALLFTIRFLCLALPLCTIAAPPPPPRPSHKRLAATRSGAPSRPASLPNASRLLNLMVRPPALHSSEPPSVWRPLVYLIVFCGGEYHDLATQLLTSLHSLGGYSGDLLFITEPTQRPRLEALPPVRFFQVHFLVLEPCIHGSKQARLLAATARMRVFEFADVAHFHPLLYLDSDVLVVRSIDPLLRLPQSGSTILAMPEHSVCSPYHAGYLFHPLYQSLALMHAVNVTEAQFFDQHLPLLSSDGCKEPSLNSGVLLIPNSPRMKILCQAVVQHVQTWILAGLPLPKAMEQPFISFQMHRFRAFNGSRASQFLQLVYLSDPQLSSKKLLPNVSLVHFPMRSGAKLAKMQAFMRRNVILLKSSTPPLPPTAQPTG